MILDKPKLSDWYHKQRYKALYVYILEIIWCWLGLCWWGVMDQQSENLSAVIIVITT